MIRIYLPIFLFILIRSFSADAQGAAAASPANPTKGLEKKIGLLSQQNTLLKGQLRQAGLEKQQFQNQISTLQETILLRNDSIAAQFATIETQHGKIEQLITQNTQLQTTLTQRTGELKAANTQIRQLEYDKKNLIDNRVVRIYNASATDVRQQFMQSLSAPGSGFQYDDDLVDDEIQITRNFNDQAEAWWVFDKTFDTILELTIRIKPHLYDAEKTLVFGTAKLLQKTRYSNKPFEEQHDREKINLYREKTFRMLEGKLSGTSDK